MKLYKVFIVDDEVLIAKGLRDTVNWEQLECVVCGIATNGIDAKKMIDTLKPDIVISDIIMPKMSGLELAEYLHVHHKNIKSILLTAYEEFSYAKKAIQYGVEEYIVKPIDKELIISAIRKIVIKLKHNESSQENIHRLTYMINEAKPIITNSILFDIAIHGNNEVDTIDEKLQNFNINIGKGSVIFFKQEDKQKESDERFHEFAINSVIHNIFNKLDGDYLLKKQKEYYVLIAKFDISLPNQIIKNRLLDLCMEVYRKCSDNLKITISGAIGKIFNDIYEIHASYTSALKALDYQFFKVNINVNHIDHVPQYDMIYEYVDYMSLYKAVQEGDIDKVQVEVEKFFSALFKTKNKLCCKQRTKALIMQIWRWLKDNNKMGDYPQSIEEMIEVSKFNTLKNNLNQFINWVLEQLSEKGNYTIVIYKTLQIIHKRYHEKDISLQLIADEIEVSAAHLSRTFKQEIGTNFIDYLTEIRVKQAKKLLNEGDKKVNEVAEAVGFYDGRYFSQVFKKRCKVTPREYRREFRKIL